MQRDDYKKFSQKLVRQLGNAVVMDENAFFFELESTPVEGAKDSRVLFASNLMRFMMTWIQKSVMWESSAQKITKRSTRVTYFTN